MQREVVDGGPSPAMTAVVDHRDSPVSLACNTLSASARSDGVERWNHSPSCTTARSRPAAIARSQARFMLKAPSGMASSKAGAMSCTPA